MLNELLSKIKSKDSIQKKLNDLILQKNALEIKLQKQKKILRKENNDVERLEYGSLSSFFYELLGTKERKLSKEKEEAYQAKMMCDSLEYQFSAIQKDILYYENILTDIHESEMKYKELYALKLDELKGNDPYLSQLENALLITKDKIKEVSEAIVVGEAALRTANKVLSKLDSAKSWSQFDLIGGGGISDLAKYSHLDDAQNHINELQSQLSRFKTELLDVKIDISTEIDVDYFLRFADFWFDNIFTDFAIYDRINNAIHQIQRTHNSISDVLTYLNELYAIEQSKEKQIQSKIDKTVLEH